MRNNLLIIAGAYLLWRHYKQKKTPARWYEPAAYSTIYLPVGTLPFETGVMRYAEIMMREGEKNKVEPAIIAAIAGKESKGDASETNGRFKGLMQLGTSEARSMGYIGTSGGLLDPDDNVKYGTKYLRYCIEKKKNIIKGISAYNTGQVEKADTPYNAEYVNAILAYVPRFRYLLIEKYPGYANIFDPDTWIARDPKETTYI